LTGTTVEIDSESPEQLIKEKKWNLLVKKARSGEICLMDIGKKCTRVPPSTLEKILDSMYRPASKPINESDEDNSDYDIEFNFRFFGCAADGTFSVPETFYLWLLTQSYIHHDLISHPVIARFMDLKWKKLRTFYYFDVICQIILAILWTWYSMQVTNQSGDQIGIVTYYMLLIILVYMLVREIFDFIIFGRQYFVSIENWISLIMIGKLNHII